MVEYHDNLLGANREQADCEVCEYTIDLHNEDFVLFAVGLSDGVEKAYRAAPLCSPDCIIDHVSAVLRDHERDGNFASWDRLFAEFEDVEVRIEEEDLTDGEQE